VLIPAGRTAKTVRINNADLTPRREVVGNDVYAVFRAPTGLNTIVIALVPTPGAGVTVDPIFAEYYQTHDGPRLLGAALTQAFTEGTKRVQYFEKASSRLCARRPTTLCGSTPTG